MDELGGRTVYPCVEYDDIAVPIRDIVRPDGSVDVYPEVSGSGYFDIDYRRGMLVLRSKGFVGLIPISDRIAIRVRPRASIRSLLYMMERMGRRLDGETGRLREYQISETEVTDPEFLYGHVFVATLRKVAERGLRKQYVRSETERSLRGRPLIHRTVGRFRAKGIRHQHVFEVHDLTADNRANRILKATAERLLRSLLGGARPEDAAAARAIRELLPRFAMVNGNAILPGQIAREVPRLIAALPASHEFYEPALWLAYLVATRRGVTIEAVGQAKFESVIVNVAEVFEGYVRTLCQEYAIEMFGGCDVADGNLMPVPLFTDNSRCHTKPDIYFARRGTYVAIADAKYKPKIGAEDRYELLAFCEAQNVRKAAFVSPRQQGQQDSWMEGMTLSGREIHHVTIDLNADDPDVEERRFVGNLSRVLGFSASAF
ncbi:MAG: hypothetical protein H0T47_11480 [Planctomycetaceae bacterium]|nr:hypothetical protein [Planctomycetaceae bacterium]